MTYLGLDIGIKTAKLAVVKNGMVEGLYAFSLPETLHREGERFALSEELAKELKLFIKKENISARRCAVALSSETAFIRRITIPWMTDKQIRVNLPYEFRDYIQGDKSAYFYDYAVVKVMEDEENKTKQLDLMIAAAPKQNIADWRTILRKAGLKLSVALPKYLTYRNLIAAYERRNPGEHPDEYCIADLGERQLRVHIYRGSTYETTRVIEYDEGILRLQDQDLPVEEQQALYTGIAVEVLRAVNFYGFNTPESNLQDVYFGGELAWSPILRKALEDTLNLRIHSIGELLPSADSKSVQLSAAAAGVALEGKGR